MKEVFECYAVIPPDETYLDDFKLRNGIGATSIDAWNKFCAPALHMDAYKSDGFSAKKVKITIETID